MLQIVKCAAVVAALSFAPLTQAATASQSPASMHADNGQGSPFGYERQKQKMMRPINDLLPQGGHEEALPVRE